MNKAEFLQLLGGFTPTPVEDVFNEYTIESQLKWYHLLCSIEDFTFIWGCKEFKFHSLCRCHQAAGDGTFVHEHVHAVISGRVLLESWKRQLRRKQIRLSKTTFKKILCGDHLAGVLRYICCRDGLKMARRGSDGLASIPHTHYERRVDKTSWIHSRGRFCAKIRNEIETKMKIKANFPLHYFETCKCDRGMLGIEKRREANRKRRAFYETEAGKLVKESYKRKKKLREEVIQGLQKLGKGPQAELQRKEIERLINMMKNQ
jgi:hypothetical protein